jgi:hypothetical protein
LLFAGGSLPKFARKPLFGSGAERPKGVIPAWFPLAFTIAPHLQLINHRGCFSPFAGI